MWSWRKDKIIPVYVTNAYDDCVEVYRHSFLTWALDGAVILASWPDRFTSREISPDVDCI